MKDTVDIPRSVSALDQLFSFLELRLAEEGIDERTTFCMSLAAEELFTNLVRHNKGGSRSILAGLDISPTSIELQLVDRGVEPFDGDSIPEADIEEPLERRHAGGLGVHLVKSIVDRLSYSYEDGELTVSVVKKRGGGC